MKILSLIFGEKPKVDYRYTYEGIVEKFNNEELPPFEPAPFHIKMGQQFEREEQEELLATQNKKLIVDEPTSTL